MMDSSILFVSNTPMPEGSALGEIEDKRCLTLMLGVDAFMSCIPYMQSIDYADILREVQYICTRRASDGRSWINTEGATVVALTRPVADALGMPRAVPDRAMNWLPRAGETWQRHDVRFIFAPVPGRDDVMANLRAQLMPELVIGAPGLRPWHFRLDDPATLADLAAAVSPRCPALGAAALTWAAEQNTARIVRDSSPLLAAMSQAFAVSRFATGPHAWDEPLINITRDLMQHDGGRILGKRWDPDGSAKRGGPGWLVTRAAAFSDLNNYPRACIQATLTRYEIAGIT